MGLKKDISLKKAFWKFLFWLLTGLGVSVVIPFLVFLLLGSSGMVTYADNCEQQTKALVPVLTATPDITDIRLPLGTKYLLLDKSYQLIDTSMNDDEYIVLQYYVGSQFIDPWLNEHLPSPEILMIGVMVFNCLLVCVLLTTHFAKILNKELFPLFKATKEIENQNLDFEMEHSRIKEFENVLRSFDKMRNSLKISLEKQWEAEQIQREQIASLAHDLKTPLTVMQGNIDLLDETNLNEEQELYLSYAMTSSEQMKQYIKTLIDISRASAGYQLQLEDINFLDFWKHILSQTEIVCKDKGLVIQQTQHNLPQNIIGDRMLLERAFMNLVSNSLEYSPDNAILYIDVENKKNYLNICITDCGCGFSKEALEHAKERFYMADQSRSSKLHYGMGLYIVDSIIKQHKGKLLLDNSIETKGAKVTIQLPL